MFENTYQVVMRKHWGHLAAGQGQLVLRYVEHTPSSWVQRMVETILWRVGPVPLTQTTTPFVWSA